jgi:hypothetical protein
MLLWLLIKPLLLLLAQATLRTILLVQLLLRLLQMLRRMLH